MRDPSPRPPGMHSQSWAPLLDFPAAVPSTMCETSPRFAVQPQSWAPLENQAGMPLNLRDSSPSKAASGMNLQNYSSSFFKLQAPSRSSLGGRPDQLAVPFLSFDPSRPLQRFSSGPGHSQFPAAGACRSGCPSPLPSAAMLPCAGHQDQLGVQVEAPLSPLPFSAVVQPQSPGHRYGRQRVAPVDVSPRAEAALSAMSVNMQAQSPGRRYAHQRGAASNTSPRPNAALSPLPCSSFPRAQSPVQQRWGGASPGRHQTFRPSSFAEFGMLGRAAKLPAGRASFGTPLHHTQPLYGSELLHHTQPYTPGGGEPSHHSQSYAQPVGSSMDSGFKWDAPLANNQVLSGGQPSTPARRRRSSVGGMPNSHWNARRASSPLGRMY